MKNLLIVLSLILGFGIGIAQRQAYAADLTIEEMQPSARVYIAVISKGGRDQFWEAVRRGAERAAADYGVEITFEGPEVDYQIEEQMNIFQEVLAKRPNAIVIAPLDARAITPYLQEAQAAGIPIIAFDTGVDSPIVRTTVATDNYAAGALAADKMAEYIGGEGKVAVLVHDLTSKTGIDRSDGFVDTLIIKYPNIEVVAVQGTENDPDKASEAAKMLLAQYPDIKGIFGGNESSTIGVVEAVKELNKVGEITIIGFDAGKQNIEAVREGIVTGAVTQNPKAIGYIGVETGIRAYEGEILPEFIDTGFAWYDKSNIDTPEMRELLYE